MTVTASAPGSIMITGEHAVVYGHPAIVAAIDQRAEVRVEALPRDQVEIRTTFGAVSTTLSALKPEGVLRFVNACILAVAPETGVSITVTSDIDPTLGLGSSAAVTIATLGALAKLGARDMDIHAEALAIVRELQGRGSGADLAASLRGGMVRYVLDHVPEPLPMPPALALKYVGYKTPTGEVLARVAAAWEGRDVNALYARMGGAAEAAIAAAKEKDWTSMATALDAYQRLMAQLGVSNSDL
ncbi:MAG: mevalonate kinase [Pseudomonadota bacterium]